MNNTKLPKESESQEIGHFAVITFNNCHPTSWRTAQTDDDNDTGLDMQVQIVDQGHYTNVFNAQIKGSAQKEDGRNKKLSADGKHFTQTLDIRTLNLQLMFYLIDFFRTTGFEERFNSQGDPLIDRAFMMRTLYHNAQKFMHDAHFSGHFLYYSP